jgi:abhydrolase domain-containing protein 6
MTNALEIGIGRAAYGFVMGFARRALGLQKRTIVVGGITIPVLTREGRGEPLVFIHGFGADKEGWLSLIGKLRGRPIVALDLPGFGAASAIDPARATAPHQARAVKGVLDALGIPHAILIGSSMGGGISMRFASDFPEATRGVVLLGSVGPVVDKSPLNHMLDEGRNPLIPSSREDFLAMLDFVTEKKVWVPGVVASYLAAKQIARRDALTKMFEAWIGQDASEVDRVLATIEAPTLVIHGERDRAIDISTGRFMAERISNAKLIELAGVGHVPQLEATARVARAIKELG